MNAKILVCLFCLFLGTTFAGADLDQPKRVKEYKNAQQGTIELPTNFGQPFLIDKSQLKELKGYQIFHIDLVYTQFRENPEFDQQTLNEKRIAQLKKYIPQIEKDQPDWTVYEQTGAADKTTARTYFHGFVIHYGHAIDYPDRAEHLSNWGVPFAVVGINNQEGGYAEYYSGSIIEMQKDIVYHKNGELVQGYYELHYREFRDQADIALSGIPMKFDGHGAEEIFNSVGMYEIRAFQNGEELVLGSPAIVNFQVTETLNDVSFFSMDEEGHWEEEAPIANLDSWPNSLTNLTEDFSYWMVSGPTAGSKIRFQPYIPKEEMDQGNYTGFTRVKFSKEEDKHELMFTLEPDQMRKLVWFEMANRNSPVYDMVSDFDTAGTRSGVKVFAKDSAAFISLILGRDYNKLVRRTEHSRSVNEPDFTIYGSPSRTEVDSQLVIVKRPVMPKKFGLVQGLRTSKFGVFNCDQTRRLAEPFAWRPVYFNQSTGEKLEGLTLTCVIDLQINASLSYAPNHIFTSKTSPTRLILFDDQDRIYFHAGKAFENNSGKYDVVNVDMVDITDKINQPSDLKRIIDLSRS